MNDLQTFADDIRDHLYGSGEFHHTNNDNLDYFRKKYDHLKHSDAYQVFRKAVSLLEEAMISAEEAGELREAEEQKLERMFKVQR